MNRTLFCLFAILTLSLAAPDSGKAQQIPRENWQQPDEVIRKLGLGEGMSIVDVGCGSGYFLFRLASQVGDEARIFGVDIDEEALKKVEDEAKARKLKTIEVVKSLPNNIMMADESVDLAFMCNVLHHVDEKDRRSLLTSIRAALRKDGRFAILDWRMKQPPEYTGPSKESRFEREKLLRELVEAGFEVDKEFDFLPRQWFFVMRTRATELERQ